MLRNKRPYKRGSFTARKKDLYIYKYSTPIYIDERKKSVRDDNGNNNNNARDNNKN